MFSRATHPILLAVIVIVTLLFGLHPRTDLVTNQAQFDSGALILSQYSLARTELFMRPKLVPLTGDEFFTMDLEIAPSGVSSIFSLIVVMDSQHLRDQLVIGQWRDHLIIMNGDDYDHTLGLPRLSIQLPQLSERIFNLRIETSALGSRLLLDDKVVRTMDYRLRVPKGAEGIAFGNSKAGNNSWEGVIRSFALSIGGEDYGILPVPSPSGIQLDIPAFPFFELLSENEAPFRWRSLDLLVNIAGFIPLGFLFALRVRSLPLQTQMLVVVLPVVLLSMLIEICQAWLPARDSSYIDLIANTTGGVTGLALAQLFRIKKTA